MDDESVEYDYAVTSVYGVLSKHELVLRRTPEADRVQLYSWLTTPAGESMQPATIAGWNIAPTLDEEGEPIALAFEGYGLFMVMDLDTNVVDLIFALQPSSLEVG